MAMAIMIIATSLRHEKERFKGPDLAMLTFATAGMILGLGFRVQGSGFRV